jgi:hypothetical protein
MWFQDLTVMFKRLSLPFILSWRTRHGFGASKAFGNRLVGIVDKEPHLTAFPVTPDFSSHGSPKGWFALSKCHAAASSFGQASLK